MRTNPGATGRHNIVALSQKHNYPAPTAFGLWILSQTSRLDDIGDFCRRVQLIGPDLTPPELRQHLTGRARCDLKTLRSCDQAIAEYRRFERVSRALDRQRGRR